MRRNRLLKSFITLLFSICCLTGCGDKHPDTVLTRFINYDETILYTNTIPYGTDALYIGDTPTRLSLEPAYAYEFTGWDNSLENITKDTTFIAQFTKVDAEYTVKFKNYDGTDLYSTTVKYGESASYVGDIPLKPSTDFATYEFIGWDKELTNISSSFTTIALFKENPIKITISIDLNGGTFTEPASMLVNKGTSFKDLSLPVPTKKIDNTSVQFLGWFTSVDGVDTQLTNSFIFNGDTNITARWEYYTFKGVYENKELYSDIFADGDTFYKNYSKVSSLVDDEKNTYEFVSWDVESDFNVHSDLVINAIFELTELPELQLEIMMPFGHLWSDAIRNAVDEFQKIHNKIRFITYRVNGYDAFHYNLRQRYENGGKFPSMLLSLSNQFSSEEFENYIEPSKMLWGNTGAIGYDGGSVEISNEQLESFDMQLFRTNYQDGSQLPTSYPLFASQYAFFIKNSIVSDELRDCMFSFNDSLETFENKLKNFKLILEDKYPLVVDSIVFENLIRNIYGSEITDEILQVTLERWMNEGLIYFDPPYGNHPSNIFMGGKAAVALDMLSSIDYGNPYLNDIDIEGIFTKEMPTVAGYSSVCHSVGYVFSLAFTKNLSKVEEQACCQFYKFLIETDALVDLVYSHNLYPVNSKLKDFESFKSMYNNETDSTKKKCIDYCFNGQSVYPMA